MPAIMENEKVTKRTTLCLTVTAVVFIVILIILCLTPAPCRKGDPCYQQYQVEEGRHVGHTTTTLRPTTTRPTTTRTTTAQPTTTHFTTPDPYVTEEEEDTTTYISTDITTSTTEGDYDNRTDPTDYETTAASTNTTTDTVTTEDVANSTADAWNTTTTEEPTTTTTTIPTTTTIITTTTTIPTTTTPIPTTTQDTSFPLLTDDPNGFCDTPECRRLAARMLDLMDLGHVDPCEDFYQYACGGVEDDPFLKPENSQHFADQIITGYLATMAVNDTVAGSIKRFYDGCRRYPLDNDRLERIRLARETFQALGMSFDQMALQDDANSDFNLTSTLAAMMKLHFTPFFDLTLDVSGEDPDSFELRLTPPLFTSPFTGNLAQDTCMAEYHKNSSSEKLLTGTLDLDQSYEKYRACVLTGNGLKTRLMQMNETMYQMNLMDHVADLDDREKLIHATRLETNFLLDEIAEGTPETPEFRKRLLTKSYELMSLQDLADPYGPLGAFIDWRVLVEELLGHSIDPSLVWVQVYFKEELEIIIEVLNTKYDKQRRLLQNMILLLWAERVYGDLVEPVGAALGSEKYCLRATKSLMHDFASYVYMQALEDRGELEDRRNKIRKMIQLNKAAARGQLEERGAATSQLYDKLDAMMGEVAQLDEARNQLAYTWAQVNVTGNLTLDAVTLLARYRRLMYRTYASSPKSQSVLWSQFLMPYSPAGISVYALNLFLVPYGAMEAPMYYGDNVPFYVNFAGMGHMVAHELMHGFDATGNGYNGHERKELSDATFLVPASECLAEQLIQPFTTITQANVTTTFTLHNRLALNELLADSAATRLALQAYTQYATTLDTTATTVDPVLQNTRSTTTYRRRRSLAAGAGGRARRQAPPLTPLPEFVELSLPYLGLTPLQTFFLRMAQKHCSHTSDIMLTVKEDEHLPAYLRVNMVLQNEPYFRQAFNCPATAQMSLQDSCPYTLATP